tara:strand:- start:33 stop:1742 length:1710 start_codon:yes stop_codon:yes gene_type:complete
MKRSGTTYTLSQHNSDYSSTTWTNDLSIGSGITGLRYIKIQNGYQGNKVGWIDNIKFWESDTASGSPDVDIPFTAGDAQSVSTLTNKSELKAYYSMDSTDIGAIANFTNTAYASSNGWETSGSEITLDTTNKGVTLTDVDSVCWIGKDFGFVAGTKWLCQFEMNLSALNGNDHGFVSITSNPNTDWKNSSVQSLTLQAQGANYWRWTLVKNNQSSFAENTTSNNTFSLNTTYYVDFIRDGNVARAKIWTNADRSGTPTYTIADLDGLSSQFTFDTIGIHHGSKDSGAGEATGWIRNVKFYNNVTAPDGCKNDFSATSDLEAMTNLPTNTIFLQTDDTPSYWWKQSDNTWKKEKYLVTEEWDFSDSTNWALSDSSDVTIADGVLNIQCNDNSVTRTGTLDLENILGSGGRAGNTWVLRWKWNLTGYVNTTSGQGIAYCVGIWDAIPSGWNTGTNGIDVRCSTHGSNSTATYHPQVFVSGSRTDSSSSSFSQSSMGTRYCELVKDASNITLKVYTTSDFSGSPEYTVVRSYTQSQHTGGRYIGYRMVNESVSATNNVSIDDLKFYNNKTSV